MKFYETKTGGIRSELEVEELLYLITEEHFNGDLEKQIRIHLPGILGEISPEEWKRVIPTHPIGAMRLYRELTDCSLVEAKNTIDEYRRENGWL